MTGCRITTQQHICIPTAGVSGNWLIVSLLDSISKQSDIKNILEIASDTNIHIQIK